MRRHVEQDTMTMTTVSIVMLLTFAACHQERPPSTATVRDSAGVRIVTHARAESGSASITLSDEPLYRYGDAAGDSSFQTISAGALQPDGGAVVSDPGTGEVTVISPDGRFREVLAHRGRGPDEVGFVMSVHVLGQDTVLLEDDGNLKLIFFEDGTLARTVSMPDRSLSVGLMIQGLDSVGRLLMTTSAYPERFDEPWFLARLVVFDPASRVADTVGAYALVPNVPANGKGNPFGPHGEVTASGGLFVYGRTDMAQLTWRGPHGHVQQIVRWDPVRAYPTEADWEHFKNALRSDLERVNRGRLHGAALDAAVKRVLDRLEVDRSVSLPLFGELHGDGQGGVWVGTYTVGTSPSATPPRRYSVVASDGTWLGTLEMPPRFRVLDIRNDRVLGVLSDSLDVESVAVYRVEPSQ